MALLVVHASFQRPTFPTGGDAPTYAALREAFIRAGVAGGAWIGDPRVTRERVSPGVARIHVACVYGWPAHAPWRPGPPLRGPGTPAAILEERVRVFVAQAGGTRPDNVEVRGSSWSPALGAIDWWTSGRASRTLSRDAVRDDAANENPTGPTGPTGRLPETAGEAALRRASAAEDTVRDAARSAASAASSGLSSLGAVALGLGLVWLVASSRRR